MAGWLHGFVWVHADSFLRCVTSPFHSFVTTSPEPIGHFKASDRRRLDGCTSQKEHFSHLQL